MLTRSEVVSGAGAAETTVSGAWGPSERARSWSVWRFQLRPFDWKTDVVRERSFHFCDDAGFPFICSVRAVVSSEHWLADMERWACLGMLVVLRFLLLLAVHHISFQLRMHEIQACP